jgi:acetyl-CoA C-acetyltransferase
MSRSVVVLSAVRSAIGGFNGTLANFEPGVLAGLVMKEAFVRAGVDAKQVTHATVISFIDL